MRNTHRCETAGVCAVAPDNMHGLHLTRQCIGVCVGVCAANHIRVCLVHWSCAAGGGMGLQGQGLVDAQHLRRTRSTMHAGCGSLLASLLSVMRIKLGSPHTSHTAQHCYQDMTPVQAS